jgi:hypothetical protein
VNSVKHTPAGIKIQKAMLSATLVLDIVMLNLVVTQHARLSTLRFRQDLNYLLVRLNDEALMTAAIVWKQELWKSCRQQVSFVIVPTLRSS